MAFNPAGLLVWSASLPKDGNPLSPSVTQTGVVIVTVYGTKPDVFAFNMSGAALWRYVACSGVHKSLQAVTAARVPRAAASQLQERAQVPAGTCTDVHTHAQTCANVIHTCTHVHTRPHASTHARTHITHTHTYTHMHTYAHISTFARALDYRVC